MNKFGLLEEGVAESPRAPTLSETIATFPAAKPRTGVDLAAIDAAAARHGFVSREASDSIDNRPQGRRRRAIPTEPTRHLAVRLTASAYDRFVAFADRHKLTYHDALINLLDRAAE